MTIKTVAREHVSHFVISDNGKISIELTEKNFHDKLLGFIATVEGDDELIRSCLTTLFDEFKGVSFNKPAIISSVIRLMTAHNPSLKSPTIFPKLSKRVGEILDVDIALGVYSCKRGPINGSTWRTCDRPEDKTAVVSAAVETTVAVETTTTEEV
jgi:hypothetical protein